MYGKVQRSKTFYDLRKKNKVDEETVVLDYKARRKSLNSSANQVDSVNNKTSVSVDVVTTAPIPKLRRQCSTSVDCIIKELVTNKLYKQQQEKYSGLWDKRRSRSFVDLQTITQAVAKAKAVCDSFEELLKNVKPSGQHNFHQEDTAIGNSSTSNDTTNPYTPPLFPTVDIPPNSISDDLNLRRKSPSLRTFSTSPRPNTHAGDIRRNKIINHADDVKCWVPIKGINKVQLDVGKTRKIKKHDVLRLEGNNLVVVGENGTKEWLSTNLEIKTVRLLNKKDVELRDTQNLVSILFFDSTKDARFFLDQEEIQRHAEKSSVKTRLLRLLNKRSSRDDLEKKGIYKCETVFDNYLSMMSPTAHQFINSVISLIEQKENVTSVGVYRTSGNLATIQKIRTEVDKGHLGILEEYNRDVDVLTGTFKLYFRELKEPLISCEVCDELLRIIGNQNNQRLTQSFRLSTKKSPSMTSLAQNIKTILGKLPEAHLNILVLLLRHLLEVVKYKDENKMDINNLALCWGPTIIFAKENCRDIIAQSAEATKVVDYLLNYFQMHPDELCTVGSARKGNTSVLSTMVGIDEKKIVQRQDSRDSIKSPTTPLSSSPHNKTSINNLCVLDGAFETVKKLIDLIEANQSIEGLYKKSGSTEKITKISKKVVKNRVGELDKYKGDVHELAGALKKYLRDLLPPLLPREKFQEYCRIVTDDGLRKKISHMLNDLPRKDTLIYLLKHINRMGEREKETKVSQDNLIEIWTNVLSMNQDVASSNKDKLVQFMRVLLDVVVEGPQKKLGPMPDLIQNLKSRLQQDRTSRYDNVDDVDGEDGKDEEGEEECQREALFLDFDKVAKRDDQITKM